MKKRILAFCDSPTSPTGFGRVAKEILGAVHDKYDVDITIWAINHNGVQDKRFNIIPANQSGDEGDLLMGRNMLCKYIKENDFDIFWSVQDAFNMRSITQEIARKKSSGSSIKSILYFPIDGHGTPKSWSRIASEFDFPVTYTKFAIEQISHHLSDEDRKKIRIAYHGTNIEEFYHVEESEVLKFRKEQMYLYGNQFLFSNVNKNQMRKDIPTTMFAFKLFLDWWSSKGYETPKPKLLLHMRPVTTAGENLAYIRDEYFSGISDNIIFPSFPIRGFTNEDMNMYANASDCFVSSTFGEGWGLCAGEHMAVKTPVILPNNTVHPEILGEPDELGDAPRGKLAVSGTGPDGYWNWRWIDKSSHYDAPPRPVTSVVSLARQMKRVFLDSVDENGNRTGNLKGKTLEQVENAYTWARDLTWSKIFKESWEPIFDSCLDRKDFVS